MIGRAVIRVHNRFSEEIMERLVTVHLHPVGDKLDYLGHKDILKAVGETISWLKYDEGESLTDFRWGFKIIPNGCEYDYHDDGQRPEDMFPFVGLAVIRSMWNEFNNKEV